MEVLGRVLQEADASRGPDVEWSVEIPADWLKSGTALSVRLPRRMTCARCSGGGCDLCDRRGAIEVCDSEAEPETTNLVVSDVPQGVAAVRIRIPEKGAPPAEDGPRGYLMLTLRAGDAPASAVQLVESGAHVVSGPGVWWVWLVVVVASVAMGLVLSYP